MVKWLRRYQAFLLLVCVQILMAVFLPETGHQAALLSLENLRDILMLLPPVFVLLGLLDVWVPKATMIQWMGAGSGMRGIALAFALGSFAAGPLYAAFPVAGVLLKKGSTFTNVLIFIGAWSTTKIPLMLFEASSMGWAFMLGRLFLDIPGILLIARITAGMLSDREKHTIYENAEKLP